MAWAMVIAAGLLEMVWSYSAKRSDGFARLGWAGLTVIASLASFCLLVFSVRRLSPRDFFLTFLILPIGMVAGIAVGLFFGDKGTAENGTTVLTAGAGIRLGGFLQYGGHHAKGHLPIGPSTARVSACLDGRQHTLRSSTGRGSTF